MIHWMHMYVHRRTDKQTKQHTEEKNCRETELFIRGGRLEIELIFFLPWIERKGSFSVSIQCAVKVKYTEFLVMGDMQVKGNFTDRLALKRNLRGWVSVMG